jgi:hypothetical protein
MEPQVAQWMLRDESESAQVCSREAHSAQAWSPQEQPV